MTISGEIKTNLAWDADLANSASEIFSNRAKSVEKDLKELIELSEDVIDVNVTVTVFSEDFEPLSFESTTSTFFDTTTEPFSFYGITTYPPTFGPTTSTLSTPSDITTASTSSSTTSTTTTSTMALVEFVAVITVHENKSINELETSIGDVITDAIDTFDKFNSFETFSVTVSESFSSK